MHFLYFENQNCRTCFGGYVKHYQFIMFVTERNWSLNVFCFANLRTSTLYLHCNMWLCSAVWAGGATDLLTLHVSLNILVSKTHEGTLPNSVVLWAELCPLQIPRWMSKPPWPQNLTVFGDKAFKEVSKLKWGGWGGPWYIPALTGRVSLDTDWHRGKHGHVKTQGGDGHL